MTLRIVAGERFIGRRRDRVRLPTGSPVSTYCSTISRNTAAERASRPGGKGAVRPENRPEGGTFITGLRPSNVGSTGRRVKPKVRAASMLTGRSKGWVALVRCGKQRGG